MITTVSNGIGSGESFDGTLSTTVTGEWGETLTNIVTAYPGAIVLVNDTYSYNGAGDLTGVDYPGSSDDVGYGYDRLGRQTTVTQGSSLLLTRAYNDAGQVLEEAYSSGPLNGLSLTHLYDAQSRRTNVTLKSGSTTLYSAGYAYSNGRLDSVSDGVNSATYSYVANSMLISNIVFKQSSTTRMTTTKSFDLLNRLTGISSAPSASSVVSFNYAYNSANQRTAVTNADNSRWAYGYDSLGQVTSGKKYWSDGEAASGQQFDYAFDDIGNRKTATRDTRSSAYSVNLVNQYTSRTVPGYVNILGEATNAATVTVNLHPSTRHSSYFRVEVPVTNSSPLWQGLTNIAVLNQGTNDDLISTNLGRMLVPQTPEGFTFDADGNLTSDSLWTNSWNAENRRTNIESRASVPTAGKVREQWTYLPDGRWVQRIVSTNNGSYVAMQTNRYVWDANVLLAVLNHTNGLELAFMRGLDLSGTLPGAGGVGGLLAVQVGLAGPTAVANTTHFVAYDGNGNVAALVNATDGMESARYEHGPFGETLRITGVMGKVNPIRFSTQYADDFTGDLKYLYRDLRDGRWLSRDPIGENGGLCLTTYIGNDAVNGTEVLGLAESGMDSCVAWVSYCAQVSCFGFHP